MQRFRVGPGLLVGLGLLGDDIGAPTIQNDLEPRLIGYGTPSGSLPVVGVLHAVRDRCVRTVSFS